MHFGLFLIRQQIAHKYGPLLTADEILSKDLFDDLFANNLMEIVSWMGVFQQGNPFEPVGAYRKFLEEMEEGKVCEIYDQDNRQKFWHDFVHQHPFQVLPKDIDFDKPWMQKN